MDATQEIPQSETPKKQDLSINTLGCHVGLLLPILFLFIFPFVAAFTLVLFTNFSLSNPISLPSQCKIVSSGELCLCFF